MLLKKTEITILLTNKDFYKQLGGDPYLKMKKYYDKLITSDEIGLTKNEIDYLINFERKERFYGLPKHHIFKEISEKCNNCESYCIEISVNEEISLDQL